MTLCKLEKSSSSPCKEYLFLFPPPHTPLLLEFKDNSFTTLALLYNVFLLTEKAATSRWCQQQRLDRQTLCKEGIYYPNHTVYGKLNVTMEMKEGKKKKRKDLFYEAWLVSLNNLNFICNLCLRFSYLIS